MISSLSLIIQVTSYHFRPGSSPGAVPSRKDSNAMATNYNKDLAHLSGMERLARLSSGVDGRSGAAQYFDYTFESLEEGRICLAFEPAASHVNLFGTVHGGVLSGLLDTAMGCALISRLAAGEHDTIIDLQAKFVRPVVVGGGPYRVIAKVEHRGRRQGTMSGRIVDPDDKLCAMATSTALIF